MSLLNTNIGPERVQAFAQPIGTVQVAGAATSTAAFLISSSKAGAPVNTPTAILSLTDLETFFGTADDIADDGWYAVKGFYDNCGTGNTGYIVNVGQGAHETSSVTTVADTAGSLNSKFFLLNSAYDLRKYYVWYNVNSAGVDPLVSGRTGIQVSVATGASAVTVAQATQAAVNAVADFTVPTTVSAVILITTATGGPVTDTQDGTAATGFTFSTTAQGARPTAAAYIGDPAAGTGLRALDVIDLVGMITVPGLPMAEAYLVQPALIEYSETVRTEFGCTLSTSYSLVSVPKEITKAQTDTTLVTATVTTAAGSLITFSGSPDLSSITPGMIVKKAGVYKATITAVDNTAKTVTVTSISGIAAADSLTLCMPCAITWKNNVVNTPSRVSAWYYNPANVLDATAEAASGTIRVIDSVGHVAGVIARIDSNHAIGGTSHAPAGIQYAGLSGIQGLYLTISERLDGGPLRLAFINRLTSFTGQGNVIFGGYSAGGSAVTADEQLIQVMRSLQYVKASLEPGLRGFLWENFSPVTQNQINAAVTSFLRNNSYLFPAGLSESQQFKVISVEPTQDELDQGLLRVRIQLRFNKAVKFIELTMEFPLPVA
jgi:hypothetical protein